MTVLFGSTNGITISLAPYELRSYLSVDPDVQISQVQARHPYDLNADGKINIVDVTIVAKAFGSRSGDPRYNPDADLDKNGLINIIDIAKVAMQLGKTY